MHMGWYVIRWFCHFDDDNYVNVPRLLEILSNYNPQVDWYLGKPSIRTPLEILNKEYQNISKIKPNISFWFATGGAGFCLSKSLALKMVSIAGGGKFMSIGEKIRLPDDVTMGYIIEYLLGKPLTVIKEFHSHLEPMKFLQQDTFHKQITFSYSYYGKDEVNTVKIDGFDINTDPTRLVSHSCFDYVGGDLQDGFKEMYRIDLEKGFYARNSRKEVDLIRDTTFLILSWIFKRERKNTPIYE
ncbi:hypothetical protein PGB90_003896 [Kerria lacca]